MPVLNTGLAKTSAATGYTIDYSCRFNDDDSAYLSKTPAGAGNLRTWTWSGWLKIGKFGTHAALFGRAYGGGTWGQLMFENEALEFRHWIDGYYGYNITLITTQLFRDPTAWYHIVLAVDTEQGTDTDRVKMYINGVQITDFSTATYPAEDYDTIINSTNEHQIGRQGTLDRYLDGYLAEVHFIDGTQLTPTSFGESGDYGEWKPIEVTGLTYGTNGFYLDFSDSAALGDDAAGSNDWTVSGLDAADQMLDSPTNNFCTLNTLDRNGSTLSEGNLKTTQAGWSEVSATFWMTTGKWYWENYADVIATVGGNYTGMVKGSIWSHHDQYEANRMAVGSAGLFATEALGAAADFSGTALSFAAGDIIGMTFDADNGIFKIYKNNTLMGTSSSTSEYATESVGWKPYSAGYTNAVWIANFGQDSSFAGEETAQGNQDGNGIGDFYYTPPTGYLALCTSNLDTPAVTPSEHFNTVLYTGNNSQPRTITGVGFQPDFVWLKNRAVTWDHGLWDVLRGVGENKGLCANGTNSEATSNSNTTWGYISGFDADGFTVNSTGSFPYYTNYTNQMVSWNWLANGSGSANTDGDMAETVTVSANVDAGFSIVTYTGDGSAATVGHGLSKAPEVVFVKNRDAADDWMVYHSGVASDAETDYLNLNDDGGVSDAAENWNDTAPTADVFSLGDGDNVNTDDETYVAYCFHSVDGYSKVGSYSGNGSSDGTFVYTGFKVFWLLIKKTGGETWQLHDSARPDDNVFRPSSNAAEIVSDGTYIIDFNANGFKLRGTSGAENESSGLYTYIAFAETPFKYSNAQ